MGKPKIDTDTFDTLEEKLSDEKVAEEVESKHNKARDDWKAGKTKVENYQDLKAEIVRYSKHHGKAAMGLDFSEHRAYDEGLNALAATLSHQLRRQVRPEEAKQIAFRMAKEHKLLDVINLIQEGFRSKEVESYKENIIDTHVDPTDRDQHIEVAKQYILKWEDHLPKRYKKMTDLELAAQYRDLLHSHQERTKRIATEIGQPPASEYEKKAA